MQGLENYSDFTLINVKPAFKTYQAISQNTGKKVMVRISNETTSAKQYIELQIEWEILTHLKDIDGLPQIIEFNTTKSGYVFLITEWIGTSLESLLLQKVKLGFSLILTIAQQLLDILENIHSNGIYHQSISLNNVYIAHQQKFEIFLIDFYYITILENYPTNQSNSGRSTSEYTKRRTCSKIISYRSKLSADLVFIGKLIIQLIINEFQSFENKIQISKIINNQFSQYFYYIKNFPKGTYPSYQFLKILVQNIIDDIKELNIYKKEQIHQNQKKNQMNKKIYLCTIQELDEELNISKTNFKSIMASVGSFQQSSSITTLCDENCPIGENMKQLHNETLSIKFILQVKQNQEFKKK